MIPAQYPGDAATAAAFIKNKNARAEQPGPEMDRAELRPPSVVRRVNHCNFRKK